MRGARSQLLGGHADGVGDIALKSRDPIPEGLVRELRKARYFTAGPPGKQIDGTFETTRINDIFTYLNNCRRLIAKG